MPLSAETHIRVTSLSAFLIPALTLWLPSGYAYGTALLLLAALLAAPSWVRQTLSPPAARWLVLAFGLMALVWLYGSDWSKGASVFNKPARYIMALPCLLYALRFPPRWSHLLAGITFGAAAGGLRALYDLQVLGLERPWTDAHQSANAIQLGNLSGWMGLMCWLFVLMYWERWDWPRRLLVLCCAALGLLGSLLSQTRGGWLAVVLCALPLLWLLARHCSWRRAGAGVLLILAMALPLGWNLGATLEQRFDWAVAEVLDYQRHGTADNSVGHRLDHGQLAFAMGLDRPLTGWGDAGYVAEKARRVEAGEAKPAVLGFGHAHNDLLDQFAKRGLIGVFGLLVLYGVPLILFWPRRQQHASTAAHTHQDALCVRLTGVSVPLVFMGFGLTQTFFAHYNGVVFYVMMVTLLFATLHGLGRQTVRAT